MNKQFFVLFLALTIGLVGCGDPASGGADIAPDGEPDGMPDTPEPAPEPEPDPTPDPQPEGQMGWDGTVTIPLGETLTLDGDDYLAIWEVDPGSPVAIVEKPASAAAEIVAEGTRLTPDVAGTWVLERDGEQVRVFVRDDYLNEDTFLNFNYTPGSPMALIGEDELWVASPPSNAVQRVLLTPDGAQPQELVPTGAWPTTVVPWVAGGHLLVAQTGRDSLGFLNLATRKLEDALPVGNEPVGIVLDERDPEAPMAYVALSGQNAVAKVDLRARGVVGTVDVGQDPRALAFDAANGRLFAASLLSGNPTPRGLLQGDQVPLEERRDIAVIDVDSFEVVDWIHEAGTILRGLWLDADKRLIVARSVSKNFQSQVAADSRPHEHGLTVVDIEPGSETLYEVVGGVELDRRDASPFTIAASTEPGELLLTLSAGRGVLVLDAETLEVRARIGTGHDPRGLVLAQGRLWTYTWLDNTVESWDFPLALGDGSHEKIEVGDDPTPTDIKQGQRMFNDATFSRHGDFSCNNCHIDGLTDGLVWNILLDGDVNTIAFRNVGGSGPFLWGGQLPTLFDFSREVLRLVGAEASGEQMELLTLYMQSVTAPPNPYAGPGGQHTEAGLRGRDVFFKSSDEAGGAGCAVCHNGPLYTNGSRVPGKTPLSTDVPSLIGTYDTGPWGRQAQWTSLAAMVDFAVQYTNATLSPDEMDDLIQFVRELPGDLLYINSASPLNQSSNVYFATPVALTFSSVLRDGQEDLFTFLKESDEGMVRVAGQWVVKGRFARFELEEGELELQTRYVIQVASGLGSVLGQRIYDPLEVTFETGEIPEVDVSGLWNLDISATIGSGSAEVAFIQSTGGRVSGTILESIGGIDLDHIDGYVSGSTLFIEPVIAQTPFGEVQINSGELELERGDRGNYAVRGSGTLRSILDANVEATRISYPAE